MGTATTFLARRAKRSWSTTLRRRSVIPITTARNLKTALRETLLEKIMRSYSEDESDLDGDYVPGEEVEGDIEYDSDASITECSEDEDEEESEESSSEVY